MATSRERVAATLSHQEPDRVVVDLGSTPVSGMHVSVVYGLRQALGLDPPNTPVKVVEPYQMLGEIAPNLMDALHLDLVGVPPRKTLFGFPNENWREWRMPQGTPVLVPEAFNTDAEPDGSFLMYPEGDRSAPPSGVMPAGGWFFDTIVRQEPIDDANLNVEDNLEEFGPLGDQDLAYLKSETERLYRETDKAIIINIGGTAFGDIALVPAPFLKHPKGIRDITEWYMSIQLRRDYVIELFERQCEIALANLQRAHGAVGNMPTVAFMTGTDFGTQRGPFCSPETYRDTYQTYHRRLNDWIHENTTWKTFIHSCGSVATLIDDFIDAGFDVLNPVQCSAEDMEAASLKERFGDRIAFWGGGVNTQQTLPFGTPDEVRREVRERLETFAPGGGFIFNPIHNVQAGTPIENVLAMYQEVEAFGR